jgi:hypothetical protein
LPTIKCTYAADPFETVADGTHTLVAASRDLFPHTEKVVSRTFKIDTLPPVAHISQQAYLSLDSGANTVTINWGWTDDARGSGLDQARCPATTVVTVVDDTLVTGQCTDLAGNVATASTIATSTTSIATTTTQLPPPPAKR